MDLSSFNAADVPANDYSLLPNGSYRAIIVESSQRLTKKAQEANDPSIGTMLVLKYQIIDGPSSGRVVWQNVNFINASEIAQDIGRKQLAAVFAACGKQAVSDSSELHDIPLKINVIVEQGKGGYEDRNSVKSVSRDASANALPTQSVSQPAVQPAAAIPQNPATSW